MTKLTKKISAPLLSLIFLLNMSSAGMAETTVSAEVGFIFNTKKKLDLSTFMTSMFINQQNRS